MSKEARSSTCTETVTSGDVSLDGDESLDSISFSLFDLDAAKQELEEFIPHVRQISEDSIKKMAGRDLMRFKEFKKQGETPKECCREEEVWSCANVLTERKQLAFVSCHIQAQLVSSHQQFMNLFSDRLVYVKHAFF